MPVSSEFQDYIYGDTLMDVPPLPLDVRLRGNTSTRNANSYHYNSNCNCPRSSGLASRYSLSGALQPTATSGSRKSVRFSEHIGCRRIPHASAEEGVFDKVLDRIKSLHRSRHDTLVIQDEIITKSANCLFCLPMMHRRHRSVSPIEAAVWDSGRRLRQVSPTQSLFKRLHDMPTQFRRLKEVNRFMKWNSQPTLKPQHAQKSRDLDLAFRMPASKMESVYMSDPDEGYVGDNASDEWDGYENPQFYFPHKHCDENIYESVNSIGHDEDYEFGDYIVCGNRLLDLLKTHKCTMCREMYDPTEEQTVVETSPKKTPFHCRLSKSLSRISIPDWMKGGDASIRTSPKLTALQERVSNSLNRLAIPEWMKSYTDPDKKVEQKTKSSRIPRFPRYMAPLESVEEAIYIRRTHCKEYIS